MNILDRDSLSKYPSAEFKIAETNGNHINIRRNLLNVIDVNIINGQNANLVAHEVVEKLNAVPELLKHIDASDLILQTITQALNDQYDSNGRHHPISTIQKIAEVLSGWKRYE